MIKTLLGNRSSRTHMNDNFVLAGFLKRHMSLTSGSLAGSSCCSFENKKNRFTGRASRRLGLGLRSSQK